MVVRSALAVLSIAPSATAREKERPATDVYLAGASATLTRGRGGDRDVEAGAVGLATSHIGFGYENPIAIRVTNQGSLSGGSNGVQGGLGTAVAGGVRLPVGKDHGVVLRGGIEGSFFGNRYLWDSLLEFPQLHVGYQWLVPKSVFDVAMKGGYVLRGRHDTGDSTERDIDRSLEWGAIGTLQLASANVSVSYTRVLAGGGSPIDLLEGAFCGIGYPFALCTNVRYELGDGQLADGSLRFVRVSLVGISVGVVIPDKLSDWGL